MNQRPDLFGAVICTYPLLDMLRYHQFLVAGYWVPEYGSSEDPEQFEFLRAYSPYHNVRSDVEYPAVLYITGDGDTRVAPLHARKMAALVQSAHPVRPALLHQSRPLRRPAGRRTHRESGRELQLLALATRRRLAGGPSRTPIVRHLATSSSTRLVRRTIGTPPRLAPAV